LATGASKAVSSICVSVRSDPPWLIAMSIAAATARGAAATAAALPRCRQREPERVCTQGKEGRQMESAACARACVRPCPPLPWRYGIIFFVRRLFIDRSLAPLRAGVIHWQRRRALK
jgi:hypothetical protein